VSESRLALDQLDLALRNLRPHPVLMPGFGVAVCAIFSRWLPASVLGPWLAALALSHVPFAVVSYFFFKKERVPAETTKWVWLATGSYSLSTMVWSLQFVFLWAPHNGRVYHAARRSVTSVLALRRGRRNDVPDDVRSVAPQAVGTVPPSITYSVPVIEAARGEARNTTRSATSFGVAGRPIGIPPSESINDRRAPS